MRKFGILILKIFTSVVILFILYYVVLFSFENPYIDRFYNKVNSYHNQSIIIGTSRARYAFDKDYLGKNYNFKNLSFTVDISPYDSSYVRYIKDITSFCSKNEKNLALITVDPYSLSIDNDSSNDYFYDYVKNDYKSVNYKYLFQNRLTPVKITEEQINKQLRVLFYGDVDNRKIKEENIQIYINKYKKPKINKFAIKNLEDLIVNLRPCYKICLIRTPITNQFYLTENNYSPNFNLIMDSISKKYAIPYYDLNSIPITSKLEFYDIHHMNSKSSIIFTKYVDSLLSHSLK